MNGGDPRRVKRRKWGVESSGNTTSEAKRGHGKKRGLRLGTTATYVDDAPKLVRYIGCELDHAWMPLLGIAPILQCVGTVAMHVGVVFYVFCW